MRVDIRAPIWEETPADSNVYDFYAGGIPFQIQQNWVPTNGGCAMSH